MAVRSLAGGIVAVALLVAGCGDSEVPAGAPTTATTTDPCEVMVEIYVAAKPIPAGMTGDIAFAEGRIEQREMPAGYRPSTAVLDPALLDGQPALADLAVDQLVTGDQFGVAVPPAPAPVCEPATTTVSG